MGIWKSENVSSADELSAATVAGLTDGGVTTLHNHDIVEDTTPQFGGDPDLNGNSFTGFLPMYKTVASNATIKADSVAFGVSGYQLDRDVKITIGENSCLRLL